MVKQVKLDIVVGTTSIKGAVRTANQASKDIAAQYLKDQVKMTNDTKRELDKRQKMYDNLFSEQEKMAKKASDAAIRAEKKATAEIERTRKQAQQRGATIMHAGGLAAQAMGANKTGYLMRMSGIAGIGTEMVGGLSTGALAGLGAGAAVGLAGLVVASKLVTVGFEVLTSAVSSTAGAFMGAIAEIGGARNLQGMIVESATAERLSAGIAGNVTENVSTRQVLDAVNDLSKNSEFKPEETAAMLRAYVGKTGNVTEGINMGKFMTDLASGANISPAQVGSLMGQIRVQFPEMDQMHLQQSAMNLWAGGKAGSVELKDTESITQALGFAHKVSPGDPLRGINLEQGMVQLAHRFTGGQSADDAVTAVRRMQEEMIHLTTDSDKYGQLSGVLGGGFLTKTPTGEQVFKNAPNTFAKLALASYEGTLPHNLMEERGQKALSGITGSLAAEFKPGMSEAEKVGIIENTFKKLEETGMTIDQFDGQVKKAKDTVDYQFKQVFNELSISLEGGLLQTLKVLSPYIREFAKMIAEKKDDIFDAAKAIALAFLDMIPVIAIVASALTNLGAGIVDKLGWLVKAGVAVNYDMNEKKSNALAFDIDKDMKWLKDPNLTDKERTDIKKDLHDKTNEQLTLQKTMQNEIKAVEVLDKLPETTQKVLDSFEDITKNAVTLSARLRNEIATPTLPGGGGMGNFGGGGGFGGSTSSW
jgi:hypothetical protein